MYLNVNHVIQINTVGLSHALHSYIQQNSSAYNIYTTSQIKILDIHRLQQKTSAYESSLHDL